MSKKSVGLLGMVLAFASVGCGSSAPIVIKPAPSTVANAACPPRTGRSFAVWSVEDKRGYANPRNVGYTQTGLFNVQASLETSAPAADVVRAVLGRALASCGLRPREGAPASTGLKVEVLTMQLTENTGFTSETIKGAIRYEVEAIDGASRASLRRFVVVGGAEASGLDTTSEAEPVLGRALAGGVDDFLKQLRSIAPPTVVAAAPSAPAQPSSLVSATARRLRENEEVERFRTTLEDKQLLSVELSLARAGTGTHPIKLKRHRVRMTFSDGAKRFPVDPLKVQERNRTNMLVPILAGGFVVPMMIEVSGNTEGLEYSGDELTMPTARNELRGVIFFDLEGAASSRPERLELELEDAVTGAVQRLELAFTR